MDALDEIFDLFSKERRRFTLYYLDEADGPVDIEELARQVEQWESDPSDAGDEDARYDDTIITLEHDHLPKIKQIDHVEYDRENDRILLTNKSMEIDVLLSVTKAIEQPSESKDIAYSEYV